ncbi:CON1B [Auxenochlorella protothecoides x Auxenochlorella symbiontica]
MTSCAICPRPAVLYCHNDGVHLCQACDTSEHNTLLMASHHRTALESSPGSPTFSGSESWDNGSLAVVPQFDASFPREDSMFPGAADALFDGFGIPESQDDFNCLMGDLEPLKSDWDWETDTKKDLLGPKVKSEVQLVDRVQAYQFSAAYADDMQMVPQAPPAPIHTPTSNESLSLEVPLTRRDRVERYLSKRRRRNFNKVVRYQCRKVYADARPRIKGRFVKPAELEAYRRDAAAAKGGSPADATSAPLVRA